MVFPSARLSVPWPLFFFGLVHLSASLTKEGQVRYRSCRDLASLLFSLVIWPFCFLFRPFSSPRRRTRQFGFERLSCLVVILVPPVCARVHFGRCLGHNEHLHRLAAVCPVRCFRAHARRCLVCASQSFVSFSLFAVVTDVDPAFSCLLRS